MASNIVPSNNSEPIRPLNVQIPGELVQSLIQAILELAADGDIRATGDGRYSVFDLIECVVGKKSPREVWKRLQEQHPDFDWIYSNFQFEGQGQRLTPVTDLDGCLEIIWLLPGDVAKKAQLAGFKGDFTVIRKKDADFLYVLGDKKRGVCKIGISSNPDKRLKQVQTGYPFTLTIWRSVYIPNARTWELRLHKEFDKYRLDGEWFKAKVFELIDWSVFQPDSPSIGVDLGI